MEDGAVGAGLDARGEGDVDGRLGGDHVHAHQLSDAPGTGNRDPVIFGTEQCALRFNGNDQSYWAETKAHAQGNEAGITQHRAFSASETLVVTAHNTNALS